MEDRQLQVGLLARVAAAQALDRTLQRSVLAAQAALQAMGQPPDLGAQARPQAGWARRRSAPEATVAVRLPAEPAATEELVPWQAALERRPSARGDRATQVRMVEQRPLAVQVLLLLEQDLLLWAAAALHPARRLAARRQSRLEVRLAENKVQSPRANRAWRLVARLERKVAQAPRPPAALRWALAAKSLLLLPIAWPWGPAPWPVQPTPCRLVAMV